MKHSRHELTLEEYRETLNFPDLMIALIRADGTFHKVNNLSNAILGWAPEELIDGSVRGFVHPDDWDKTLKVLVDLQSGELPLLSDFIIRCLQKAGGYKWVSWSAKCKDGMVYAMGADVTQKVHYEQELTVQSLVLETISEAVVITDMERRIVYANAAVGRLFGHKVEELLGSPITLLNGHDEDATRSGLLEAYAEVTTKGMWEGEWVHRRKDGLLIETSCRLSLMKMNGEDHWLSVIRDISQKKKQEEDLRKISERLGLAVKIGKIGVWEWESGSEKITWDVTAESIFGFAPGQFPGSIEVTKNSIYPEDRERLWSAVKTCLNNKGPYVLDHRIVRQDGSVGWVQCSGTAFFDAQGKAYYMVGTVLDITERKEAEEDQKFLAIISEFLSRSFDYRDNIKDICEEASRHFCDGCVVDQLHPDGTIERIVVVHPDDGMRQRIFGLQADHPHRYGKDHPLFTSLITGKTVLVDDVQDVSREMRYKHGDSYVDDLAQIDYRSVMTVRLKGWENLLGTLTFFTRKDSGRKFRNRHVRLAEEIAFRVSMSMENSLLYLSSQEAIKARDEFLSIASHELKTPLTSLTLQNHMRQRHLDKGNMEAFSVPGLKKMLDADDRQLQRITRLIDDMLDIARISSQRLTIHKEQFDFCGFVYDVLERFRPQMEAMGCDVSTSFNCEARVNADTYRIEQVVVNMLTNAMKYGAGRPITIEVQTSARKVALRVRDQGPGIAPEDCDRIFQRFERAVSSNEVSGLGLGLYISRQIMDQHDGSLSVVSRLGEGSTFIMELPLQ